MMSSLHAAFVFHYRFFGDLYPSYQLQTSTSSGDRMWKKWALHWTRNGLQLCAC
ncbi:TPA: hypothetical protein N0F65_010943 [Lagenidium giganteum]|uniref:Uncharacterized protein n=1 Tax=Lagenidium giganteum TaxID=4803 RepID=A0AAV2Z112_9STRA|nr:TPA: hypothetical protein N0F65_010943 [Lagenidium giganteum]